MSHFNRGAGRPKEWNGGQLFTASGSYVVPAGVTRGKLKVCGPGYTANASGQMTGHGGMYCEREVNLTPGETLIVTVGAINGANSSVVGSFGTILAYGGSQVPNSGSAGGPGWGAYGLSGGAGVGATPGAVEVMV